ncbi:DUF930 domain-containing protein [Rhizobium gallicum]|uniref:DUF930 domain-containing protein n=1 Tax=Rhizobium gallicum TaxID=56730 RepID=UPI003B8A6A44
MERRTCRPPSSRWRRISKQLPLIQYKYKCEAAPAIEAIVAFEFSVGEEIPESEWETHFLPVDDDEAN